MVEDKEISKIERRLAEIRAELILLNKTYNRIDTWIAQIYERLDKIERQVDLLVKHEKYKTMNNWKNKLRKLLRKHPIIRCY